MKYTNTAVNADLRIRIFDDIVARENVTIDFVRINDHQYGCLLTDLNGVERYVRLGAIVAEERTDMTARELMQHEINTYYKAQQNKVKRAANAAKKAAADKARREAKAAEKAAKEAE